MLRITNAQDARYRTLCYRTNAQDVRYRTLCYRTLCICSYSSFLSAFSTFALFSIIPHQSKGPLLLFILAYRHSIHPFWPFRIDPWICWHVAALDISASTKALPISHEFQTKSVHWEKASRTWFAMNHLDSIPDSNSRQSESCRSELTEHVIFFIFCVAETAKDYWFLLLTCSQSN